LQCRLQLAGQDAVLVPQLVHHGRWSQMDIT
jgi:hypothetical protein